MSARIRGSYRDTVRGLNKLPDRIDRAAARQLLVSGLRIEAGAKTRVRVATGFLRNSYGHRVIGAKGHRVRVGTDTEYSVYQEHLEPPRGRAHLHPAAEEERPRLKREMQARLNRVMEGIS